MKLISRITDWLTTPYTVYLILKEPSMSLSVKIRSVIGMLIIFGYIASPIDLIPGFIPVAGILDDLVVAPLLLALMRQLIPDIAIMEQREKAQASVRHVLIRTAIGLSLAAVLALVWLGILIYFVIRFAGQTQG